MNAYDYIEDYMSGELSGEALNTFEQSLLNDKKLKEMVDNFQEMKVVSSGLLELELLHEVKSISNALNQKPPEKYKSNSGSWVRYLSIPAVLIFFGALVYFLMYDDQNTLFDIESSNQQIVAVYKEPIWPVNRSGNTDYIAKGISQYLNGDLEAGKQLLLDSVENKVLGQYWLAEMYLKEMEVDSVMKYLPVTAKEVPRHRAVYLYCYALIQSGKEEEAKELGKNLPATYKKLLGY